MRSLGTLCKRHQASGDLQGAALDMTVHVWEEAADVDTVRRRSPSASQVEIGSESRPCQSQQPIQKQITQPAWLYLV